MSGITSDSVYRKCGFEVVEVNASDTRNKSDTKLKDGINGKLSNKIKELVNNTSILLVGAPKRRQVLVMDEVDGMSGDISGLNVVATLDEQGACACAAMVALEACMWRWCCTPKRDKPKAMSACRSHAGGDRGGVADLIASIKISKMPIVCVCNDKYKQSMRSLRNHCIELDWRKPTKQQVASRLQSIARAEGLAINTVRSPTR